MQASRPTGVLPKGTLFTSWPCRAALQQHAQAAPQQRAPCMAQSALHGSRLTDGPFPDAGNTKAALMTGRPLCHGAARQHLIMPGAARGLTPGPA